MTMTSDTPSQAARAESVAPEVLAKQVADAASDMCEIARIVGEWRHGPKQSLTAIREIRACLAASPPAEALPAGVGAVRADILKTALQRIGSASALSINAASASDALSWCRALAREALEAALTSAPAPEDRS